MLDKITAKVRFLKGHLMRAKLNAHSELVATTPVIDRDTIKTVLRKYLPNGIIVNAS